MQVVQKFRTNDGREFTNKADAKAHEVEQAALCRLRTLLKPSIDSALVVRGNIDNVLKSMLLDSAVVTTILKAYRLKRTKNES